MKNLTVSLKVYKVLNRWFPKYFLILDRTSLISVLRKRDGDYCPLCGNRLTFKRELSVNYYERVSFDHIEPKFYGGDSFDVDNIQLCHLVCNYAKNNMTQERFHEELYSSNPDKALKHMFIKPETNNE